MSENVFEAEWRACLEAHYVYVVRNHDTVTEPSLTLVMKNAHFTDAELAELRVRATMHVDDVGADFVPDLDVLEAEVGHALEVMPEANEAGEPRIFAVGADVTAEADIAHEDEAAASDDEDAAEADETDATADEHDDPDRPQQLSLF
ncbi:MAG: hypothetical protein J0L63_03895 [Anaerolineae bacterium]|nr:hypothetical protein [Anaerolineae bacterium]MBN8618022.1 hypothetical protein [Anaerolineae bacterium]